MRTLKESLFDNELTTNKLPIEKEIKQFRNKDIAKLTSEEIKQKIHSIMGLCEKYTYDELKTHPVDLLKHVIIIPAFEGAEIGDYIFVYSRDIPNWGIESVFNYIDKKTKNWVWHNYPWKDFDRFKDWDKKVDCMRSIFLGSNVRTFYVIPEGLSKDLIKNMSGK
jgi:hypothetical protein